jgi:hypothetical protein
MTTMPCQQGLADKNLTSWRLGSIAVQLSAPVKNVQKRYHHLAASAPIRQVSAEKSSRVVAARMGLMGTESTFFFFKTIAKLAKKTFSGFFCSA